MCTIYTTRKITVMITTSTIFKIQRNPKFTIDIKHLGDFRYLITMWEHNPLDYYGDGIESFIVNITNPKYATLSDVYCFAVLKSCENELGPTSYKLLQGLSTKISLEDFSKIEKRVSHMAYEVNSLAWLKLKEILNQ